MQWQGASFSTSQLSHVAGIWTPGHSGDRPAPYPLRRGRDSNPGPQQRQASTLTTSLSVQMHGTDKNRKYIPAGHCSIQCTHSCSKTLPSLTLFSLFASHLAIVKKCPKFICWSILEKKKECCLKNNEDKSCWSHWGHIGIINGIDINIYIKTLQKKIILQTKNVLFANCVQNMP